MVQQVKVMVQVVNPYDFSTKTCVYDTTYLIMNQGGIPDGHEIHLYVMDDNDQVIDSVVAISRLLSPSIGEEVLFIENDERVGKCYKPAIVITRAEYETWHEFNKA